MILKLTIIFSAYAFCACAGEHFSLCSFTKSSNSCGCFYKIDGEFPTLRADCARLNWKVFPKDVQLVQVQDLDLSHNEITILDVEKNKFESQTLITINLKFNLLETILPDFFAKIPNLNELDLSNNKIHNFINSNIFRGLKNLTKLNLAYNGLSTLPQDIFAHLPNLKELDLSYNYLGALIMNSNDLFNLTVGLPFGISNLKLDGLEIEKLHSTYFRRAENLKYLSLADNRFKKIPAVPYTLDYLDLSGNPIVNVSANRLNYHSLKVLKLNRLELLQVIDRYAFYNLQRLEELHMQDCKKLREFNDLAFGIVENDMGLSLKEIHLARSGLTRLNKTYFKFFSKLERLDLQNNPWKCDCELLWLRDLDGVLDTNRNMICTSPLYLMNRNIMNLTLEDLAECSPPKSGAQKMLITILLLLIIILAILIIYLIYLGPFHVKNKYKGIGPQSPYQNNTIGIIPIQAEYF